MDSPVDDSLGAAGIDDGGWSCWEEVEPAAAVLAAVDDQADRRTVAVEGPAARRAVVVERGRVDLGLGMFTSRWAGRKRRRRLKNSLTAQY